MRNGGRPVHLACDCLWFVARIAGRSAVPLPGRSTTVRLATAWGADRGEASETAVRGYMRQGAECRRTQGASYVATPSRAAVRARHELEKASQTVSRSHVDQPCERSHNSRRNCNRKRIAAGVALEGACTLANERDQHPENADKPTIPLSAKWVKYIECA